MKKVSIFIIMILALSIMANAEQVVGSYFCNYFKENFEIEADAKKDKLNNIFIGVSAKDSESAYIIVEGEDLADFRTSLKLVRDKYLEWMKIAKENDVREMNKTFDIKFPMVKIVWLGSEWWVSYKFRVKMDFLIFENGEMVAKWCPTVVSTSNQYIDETIYFVFENEDDFNSLIDQLDYNVILDKLVNTKKNEDLFK